jgi:hypothetical protein
VSRRRLRLSWAAPHEAHQRAAAHLYGAILGPCPIRPSRPALLPAKLLETLSTKAAILSLSVMLLAGSRQTRCTHSECGRTYCTEGPRSYRLPNRVKSRQPASLRSVRLSLNTGHLADIGRRPRKCQIQTSKPERHSDTEYKAGVTTVRGQRSQQERMLPLGHARAPHLRRILPSGSGRRAGSRKPTNVRVGSFSTD